MPPKAQLVHLSSISEGEGRTLEVERERERTRIEKRLVSRIIAETDCWVVSSCFEAVS